MGGDGSGCLVSEMVAGEVEWLCSGIDLLDGWFDRGMFVANLLVQVTMVPALVLNVQHGHLDKAAVGLYFVLGFGCITWAQWRRLSAHHALRRSMQPLLDCMRLIEEEAVRRQAGRRTERDSTRGLERMRHLSRVMGPLRRYNAVQGPITSVLLLLLYLVTGRHMIPTWPEVGAPWIYGIILLQISCVAYSARVFLVLSGLHWMSSLGVDCALHLLADRAELATSWQDLVGTVRVHQRLLRGMQSVQDYFAADLSKVVFVLALFGCIGSFRLSMGVTDPGNVFISVIVLAYVTSVCVAAEMQETAGDVFYMTLCNCPWVDWEPAARGRFTILLAHTIQPTQVRFRYFGPMGLETLSTIVNTVFRYTQLLRASVGEKAYSS